MAKLFTYCYQEDSESPGYGIRLALSKGIVEKHHGYPTAESRIAAESSRGCTVLTIRLLRKNRHFSADQVAVRSSDYFEGIMGEGIKRRANDVHVALKQPSTILIIEERQLRGLIQDLFQAEFNTLQAENGLQGLEVAQEHIPDVFLLDVMMPEMNGVELSAQLKGNLATSHIPVVLLTARTQSAQVIEGVAAGAEDYLIKPFDSQVLQLKTNNLVCLRDLLKERCRKINVDRSGCWGNFLQDANESFIAKLRAMVIENLSKPGFGINELARQVGMSASVLYPKTGSLTGMTANDFVKTIGLNEAQRPMDSGAYSLGEVATIIG